MKRSRDVSTLSGKALATTPSLPCKSVTRYIDPNTSGEIDIFSVACPNFQQATALIQLFPLLLSAKFINPAGVQLSTLALVPNFCSFLILGLQNRVKYGMLGA